MNEFISLIPIRRGSKGLKNKNLALLEGIPLYLRAVNQALRITKKCILNTDIKEVLNKKNLNNNIIFFEREKKFAEDHTTMNEVLKDLFSKMDLRDKNIILLQATSPLREDFDILNAIKLYKEKKYSMVLSAKKVDSVYIKFGYAKNTKFIPFKKKYMYNNRQELPEVYSPNGAIYIFSTNDFLRKNKLPDSNIGFYEMSDERSIDIDSQDDLIKIKNKLEIFKNK